MRNNLSLPSKEFIFFNWFSVLKKSTHNPRNGITLHWWIYTMWYSDGPNHRGKDFTYPGLKTHRTKKPTEQSQAAWFFPPSTPTQVSAGCPQSKISSTQPGFQEVRVVDLFVTGYRILTYDKASSSTHTALLTSKTWIPPWPEARSVTKLPSQVDCHLALCELKTPQ